MSDASSQGLGTRATRRTAIAAGLALAAAAPLPGAATSRIGFVRRDGLHFTRDGRPYRFVGANLWYGAYLAADAPFGDRARLARELDALAAIGVTNLRVLAGSERGPLRNAVQPSFRGAGPAIDVALLGGLDHLLGEMRRRGMTAVLYLTNFWEWSGGMMTYLTYARGSRYGVDYIDMNDPAHPWPAFPDMVADFYSDPRAVALYHDYVRALVGRTNAVTGTRYADDPTIMAWQLANEPRPGGTPEQTLPRLPAFYRWIDGTARLIRRLAPDQLISTGSEGLKGAIEREDVVIAAHDSPAIDYLTAHIWPQNWGWIDPADLAGGRDKAAALVADYLARHVALARRLGKPLTIEEFGYSRDGGSFDPATTTRERDRFYGQVFDAALSSMAAGGPIAGTNFWGWGGEGRALHDDRRFRAGDAAWMGDPPHEPQGWYSVLAGDASTRAAIADHARAVARLPSNKLR